MLGGGHGADTNSYNRARRRLRCRQSNASAAEVSQFHGPSGPYQQQIMPAWSGSLTWLQSVVVLALLTVFSGCLAGCSLMAWSATYEIELDYTDCAKSAPAVCWKLLHLEKDMQGPVYVYYAMTGTFFNHRRVQMDWCLPQLIGQLRTDPAKVCKRFARINDSIVLPCGTLPNAIFNDTFTFIVQADNSNQSSEIPLTTQGISWRAYSTGLFKPLDSNFLEGTAKPPSWPLAAAQRYQQPFADAEDLHIWLRTPALSEFRNMKHRMLVENGVLPKGTYQVKIEYNYPVTEFGGTKRVIIANKSMLGGKNRALVALPGVACACYALLCICTLIECQCRPRR